MASEFWKLACLPLPEDLKYIEHMINGGACFNFIKDTTTLTSEPCSPSATNYPWWYRPCYAEDKGLGQRTPQPKNKVLNPKEIIPWF